MSPKQRSEAALAAIEAILAEYVCKIRVLPEPFVGPQPDGTYVEGQRYVWRVFAPDLPNDAPKDK